MKTFCIGLLRKSPASKKRKYRNFVEEVYQFVNNTKSDNHSKICLIICFLLKEENFDKWELAKNLFGNRSTIEEEMIQKYRSELTHPIEYDEQLSRLDKSSTEESMDTNTKSDKSDAEKFLDVFQNVTNEEKLIWNDKYTQFMINTEKTYLKLNAEKQILNIREAVEKSCKTIDKKYKNFDEKNIADQCDRLVHLVGDGYKSNSALLSNDDNNQAPALRAIQINVVPFSKVNGSIVQDDELNGVALGYRESVRDLRKKKLVTGYLNGNRETVEIDNEGGDLRKPQIAPKPSIPEYLKKGDKEKIVEGINK